MDCAGWKRDTTVRARCLRESTRSAKSSGLSHKYGTTSLTGVDQKKQTQGSKVLTFVFF